MPCNSDYLDPNGFEVELSRVACLLDEISGKKWENPHWSGFHPAVYCKVIGKAKADKMVDQLCKALQEVDVTKYSLEMQLWWRDHKAADEKRIQAQIEADAQQVDREAALAKLTDYERQLLDL